VDDKPVPVRILHYSHVAARRLKRLGCEWYILIFQFTNRRIEIFDFKRSTSALIRWSPLITDIRNRQRVLFNKIFDPFPAHHFIRHFQTEHVFVELPCSRNIRYRDGYESDFLDSHFTHREAPNPNSQIPGKNSIAKSKKERALIRSSR